ncbi:MAG: hypothetical protein ACHP7I_01035 [Terriglobales bacterium]
MLLTIVQAAPQVPRKAADNPAQARQQIKSESENTKQNAAQSAASVEADANRPTKSNSNAPETNNPSHDVRITGIPNVTVTSAKRDAADWGYWLFSFLLVIVGILQVVLLFGTLKAIQRQATLMERQINKERPRIRVEVKPFKLQAADPSDESALQVVEYTVACYGFTHAFIEQDYFFAELRDTPDWTPVPEIRVGAGKSSAVIAPNSLPKNSDEPFLTTDFEIKSIEHGKSFVHFGGIIKYRDFSEKERETTVYFVWQGLGTKKPRGIGLGRWQKTGPPEANHET